ncbi:MAG: RNA polymerase sigma factor [Minisyncoccia bacterium]
MKKNKFENLSDGEILNQSIKRPWMFGLLVNKYQKAFLRRSTKILHSREEAEDAVQETFLKIYKNAWQFSERRETDFNSWAYKILTNTCYDTVKVNKKILIETLEFADLDVAGVSVYENTENRSMIESVLQRMPKNLSKFLRLYFLEEKSQKEIAEEEHISLVAVRSRIHRAKKYFRTIALQII